MCFTRTYTGRSRLFPHLKSLASFPGFTLYSDQFQRKTRHCLAARRRLPDAAFCQVYCLIPRLYLHVCTRTQTSLFMYFGLNTSKNVQIKPGNEARKEEHVRPEVASFPGFTLYSDQFRRRLQDGVWQTPSGRWGSARCVCVCQAAFVCQMPSGRPCLAARCHLPDSHLPDAISFYVAIGLSTRIKPGNEARLNSYVF